MSEIAIVPFTVEEFASVVGILEEGFPQYCSSVWVGLERRLALIQRPKQFPQVGYVMKDKDTIVGVLFTFFSERLTATQATVICNVSSWYIAPAYRSMAILMLKKVTNLDGVIVTNYSPIKEVVPIFQACKFRSLTAGMRYIPPLWNIDRLGLSARCRTVTENELCHFDPWEQVLLRQHIEFGCKGSVLVADNQTLPILWLAIKKGPLLIARIIYSPNRPLLLRYAEHFNFHLLRKGVVGFSFDSDETDEGLRGLRQQYPIGKMVRGDESSILMDLAYSERVLYHGLFE